MQLTSDFSCQTLDVTVSAPDKRVRSNARHAIQTGYFVGILVPLSTFWRKKRDLGEQVAHDQHFYIFIFFS